MNYPYSPRQRHIQHVAGNAEAIIQRGSAIKALGEQMLDAATTLENLKNSSIDEGAQKGQAIEKLRESIDDSYSTLREAGNLYEPVGPVLITYGNALARHKPLIDAYADQCEELWRAYEALPGDREGRGTGSPLQPEPGSPEAEAQADEDAAKQDAYEAYLAVARQFDSEYDDWSEAFETAADGVHQEVSGSIKDGFWEFLDDLMEVLNWAGLVIGVLALIVGGPFVAIAFAIAAAVLVVASIQMFDSSKSWGQRWTSLGFAIVGVVPFGKFGAMADEVTALGKLKVASGWGAPYTLTSNMSDNLLRVTSGHSIDDLTTLANRLEGMGADEVGRALVASQLDGMGPILQRFAGTAADVQTLLSGPPNDPFNTNYFEQPDDMIIA